MKILLLTATVIAAMCSINFAEEANDGMAARQKAWDEYLEARKFKFPSDQLGMITSLENLSGDCQLHIVYDPATHHLTFKFVRDGKEIIAIEGHVGTSFRTFDSKLYFARFGPIQPGCAISAYDLKTGRQLWTTSELMDCVPLGTLRTETGLVWLCRMAIRWKVRKTVRQ